MTKLEHLLKYYLSVERLDENDINKKYIFVRHNYIWIGIIIKLIFVKDHSQCVIIKCKYNLETPIIICDKIKAFELLKIKQKIADIKVKWIINQLNLPDVLISNITKYLV